jgi:hypothetical protein
MFISRIVARRASVEAPRLAPNIALMDGNPLLNPVGSLPPQVYWRRRALAAAVAVLVVWFAWSWLPGGGGANAASPGKPKTTPTAGVTPATTTPAAAPTTTAPATTPAKPATAATVTSPAPTTTAAPTTPKCSAAALKLTLSADHTVYAKGVDPHFVLTVSNVGKTACRVDVGTANRGFLVTSGADRIWSSLDCNKNSANPVVFKPGETVSYSRDWTRQRSTTSGCAAKGVDARAGTYVVEAHLGDQLTRKAVFRLT